MFPTFVRLFIVYINIFAEIDQPFQTEWLDTKLDLLEFLEDDQESAPQVVQQAEESANAQDVLNSLIAPVVVEPIQADADALMATFTSLTEALDVPMVLESGQAEECSSSEIDFNQPLSPVSVDDLESLLSESGPSTSNTAASSPLHGDHDDAFNTILMDLMSEGQASSAGPLKKSKGRKKTPYGSTKKDYDKSLDRKQRKKQQNKDAALRYRYKKRSEQDILNSEADELESKNKVLREKVDSMTREIQYLKDLMAEVHKAKTSS